MRSDAQDFPGRLFVAEGIDGSGKSTQLSLLQKWLELLSVFETMSREYGFQVIETAAQIEDVCDDIKNRLQPLFRSDVRG